MRPLHWYPSGHTYDLALDMGVRGFDLVDQSG